MSESIMENNAGVLCNNIISQIKSINGFIDWTNSNLRGSRKIETYKKLVDQRRMLKKNLFSLSSNPAIAAFGESQKGKSYVVSSLLSFKRQPYTVKDGYGKSYNFIEEINQISRDTESTAVVTRFTSEVSSPSPDFPVTVKLLSIKDAILVLCDTYYKDVQNPCILDKEDLNSFVETMRAKYENSPVVQHYITEDELFDIRDYLDKHMKVAAKELVSSDFFDGLIGIICRIAPENWPELFCKLWGDNDYITTLFSTLVSAYTVLHFADVVYIPITTVLNRNVTMMGTPCLMKMEDKRPVLGNSGNDATSVAIFDGSVLKTVDGFNKSILCALTSEIVYKIDDNSVNEEMNFSLEGVDSSISEYLIARGWDKAVTRSFLESTDILDFPGARSRLEIEESKIPVELCKQMFLRGKVAYLFNKYCEEKLINILLLCHDYMQNGPTVMPNLVKEWVNSYVGEEVGIRSENLGKSTVPPLFLIATKFNKDLEMAANATANEQVAKRWQDRFKTVLYNQVLMATSNPWFDEWTNASSFKNTYLLRDFKFSGDVGGDTSKLFHGFIQIGKETSEYDKEFRSNLKQSFLDSEIIKTFFDDPELAWDAASTQNNDGALLIIKNLGTAAGHIKEIRNAMFSRDVASIKSKVYSMMMDYYHQESDEDMLMKKLGTCGSFLAEIDVLFGRDPYFFGRLIQKLQVRENIVFDYYFNSLHNPSVPDASKSSKEFNIILSRCHGRINSGNSFETNLEILRQEYHFPNVEMCRTYFETTKGISLERMFNSDGTGKSKSSNMASGAINMWFDAIMSNDALKYFEHLGLNTILMLDFLDNMKIVANEVNLSDTIANAISPFVDSYAVSPQVLDLIADTTCEIINSFVTDFGYRYYSTAKVAELRKLSEENCLHLAFDGSQKSSTPSTDEEISSLFDSLQPGLETTIEMQQSTPAVHSYNKWVDYLWISFISAFKIPDFDREANRRLGNILIEFKSIN